MLEKTIDTGALRRNWLAIRRRARARRIFAVLKSDAYGHGLSPCAATLADCADGIAVTAVQDALTLRDSGYRRPLLLLEGMFSAADAKTVAEAEIWPVVHTAWQLTALENMPAAARLTVFLKINTGMHRLGLDADEAPAALEFLRRLPAVREVVLMTHFADADLGARALAAPLARLAALRGGLSLSLSLGNSAATLFGGDIGDDWARVGVALYGSSPAPQLGGAGRAGAVAGDDAAHAAYRPAPLAARRARRLRRRIRRGRRHSCGHRRRRLRRRLPAPRQNASVCRRGARAGHRARVDGNVGVGLARRAVRRRRR